jgi:hypothetical protein
MPEHDFFEPFILKPAQKRRVLLAHQRITGKDRGKMIAHHGLSSEIRHSHGRLVLFVNYSTGKMGGLHRAAKPAGFDHGFQSGPTFQFI